jgi:hypothetical protein
VDEIHKAVEVQSDSPSTLSNAMLETTIPYYSQGGRGRGGRNFGGRWNSGRGGRGRSSRESGGREVRFDGECRHCKIYGHKWAQCRKRLNGEPKANATKEINLSDDEQDAHPSDKASSNVIIKKQRIASLRPHSLTLMIFRLMLAIILHIVKALHLQTDKRTKERTVNAPRLGWIIDSGASVHVCNNLHLLRDVKCAFTTWQLADGTYLNSSLMGTLGNIGQCIYVPNTDTNIISVKLLNEIGYSVSLSANGTITVTRNGVVTLLAHQYIDDMVFTVDEFEGLHFM